jgi:hypothetical protein
VGISDDFNRRSLTLILDHHEAWSIPSSEQWLPGHWPPALAGGVCGWIQVDQVAASAALKIAGPVDPQASTGSFTEDPDDLRELRRALWRQDQLRADEDAANSSAGQV